MRRRRIYTPLALTLAFLVVVVAALLVGGLRVRAMVASSFVNAGQIRVARVLVAEVLREQLDEETGIRGYAVARQRVLLEPYDEATGHMPGTLARVSLVLQRLNMPQAQAMLEDASRMNNRWLDEVAFPILTDKNASPLLELHGKRLVDRLRGDMAATETMLAEREVLSDSRAQRAVLLVGTFAAGAIACVIAGALLFTAQQYRLAMRLERERERSEEERRRTAEVRAAYETEKRIADTLQEGFTQTDLPRLPTVRFSAIYLPASEEARIGGDWYDVLDLSHGRVLIAIGDVAGHGIEAAVAMNRARHLVVSCALVDPNPGPMLQRVNAQLLRSASPMITAVAGLVDARSCAFTYSAAGHPPPVIVEPGRPARLLEVGSLPLGVMREASYRTYRVQSVPGAMLVLYTDGAIEHSRDVVAGEVTLLSAVEAAARFPEQDAAATIVANIFGERKIADDVAILTIRFGDVSDSGAPRRVA